MEVDPKRKVMTIGGAVDGETLGMVLMNERVLCDSKRSAVYSTLMKSKGHVERVADALPIVLENLADIRTNPFGHMGNMTLGSSDEALRELEYLRDVGCRTVVDVTNASCGRNYTALQDLAMRLGINIIIGTTCHEIEDPQKIDSNAKDMERDLLYGIDKSTVRAGFIGEVEVSTEFRPEELRSLKACALTQKATNAPLIVAESTPAKHAVKILDHVEAVGGMVHRTVLSHMDLYAYDIAFIERILDRGAYVSFDQFSVSSVIYDPDQVFPTVDQVVDCICSLLKSNRSRVNQIVLSSGVFMKLQYRRYGGFGFNILFQQLLPRLSAKGIGKDQIDTMMVANPVRLLQWWVPPPEIDVPKDYMTCTICQQIFEPIEGEYFTKFTFCYCGTKCLRKHRKMGFKKFGD